MNVLLRVCCDECKDDPCDPCEKSEHPCPVGEGRCCPSPPVRNLTVNIATATNFFNYSQGNAYKIGNNYYQFRGKYNWENLQYVYNQPPVCCIDGATILEEGASVVDNIGQKCEEASGWFYSQMISEFDGNTQLLNEADGGFINFFAVTINNCGCATEYYNYALSNGGLSLDIIDNIDKTEATDTLQIIEGDEQNVQIVGGTWRLTQAEHIYIT